jgi:hypothetical protein
MLTAAMPIVVSSGSLPAVPFNMPRGLELTIGLCKAFTLDLAGPRFAKIQQRLTGIRFAINQLKDKQLKAKLMGMKISSQVADQGANHS